MYLIKMMAQDQVVRCTFCMDSTAIYCTDNSNIPSKMNPYHHQSNQCHRIDSENVERCSWVNRSRTVHTYLVFWAYDMSIIRAADKELFCFRYIYYFHRCWLRRQRYCLEEQNWYLWAGLRTGEGGRRCARKGAYFIWCNEDKDCRRVRGGHGGDYWLFIHWYEMSSSADFLCHDDALLPSLRQFSWKGLLASLQLSRKFRGG